MKIAILLPYKENYSKLNAGAVSIYVNDTTKLSKFKNDIRVYGSTESKKVLNKYININFKKKFYQSSSIEYLKCFISKIENKKTDILEVHNRPHYIDFLNNLTDSKIVLFFHNDPLKMQGSESVKERLNLLNITDKIIFNSNWSKSRFLIDLPYSINQDKLKVIHQSTSKTKIDFTKKKNIISFIGKLNSSKGFDLFGKAIIKILDNEKPFFYLIHPADFLDKKDLDSRYTLALERMNKFDYDEKINNLEDVLAYITSNNYKGVKLIDIAKSYRVNGN